MKRLGCATLAGAALITLAGAALITLALLLILLACGGGGSSTPTKQASEQIEVQLDSGGGIYALFYGKDNLMGITRTVYDYKGGYYLIGSCPQNGVSIDDENNVNSQTQMFGDLLAIGETNAIAGTMRSKTSLCPGAPYSFTLTRPTENKIFVRLEVGPTPAAYAALSVPLDLQKSYFDSFRFVDVTSYSKMSGACNNWITVSENSDLYSTLDPLCGIPGGGSTGLAQAPAYVVEACSSELKVCVKRTLTTTTKFSATFVNNHHGTNNTEMNIGNNIPSGSTFLLEEEILIYAKQ